MTDATTARSRGRAGRVSKVVGLHDVPVTVRSLAAFADPDYIDLFTVTTPIATDHSAEEWARAILEQTPLSRRNARRLWRVLGLRLGPAHSPDYVHGWKIAARGDNWLRIETASWYAAAHAVCLVEDEQVSLSLSLRYDRPPAALIGAFASGLHQRGLPVMLHQAVKLMTNSQTNNS